jgi:hypothetical protein
MAAEKMAAEKRELWQRKKESCLPPQPVGGQPMAYPRERLGPKYAQSMSLVGELKANTPPCSKIFIFFEKKVNLFSNYT